MIHVTMTETRVKRTLAAALLAVASIAFLLVVPARTDAAINSQINFQGKLTNPDGTNVTNGTYSIVFSIYSVSTGGTAVWTETQPSVTVTDGIFQVALGSVTSLPGSVDFNSSSLYLGVKVGADAEMTPRIQFTAAPYAFNADKLGGIASSGYVQLSPGSQQTGFINVSGNITAGGTYNGNTFTGSSLQFSSAVTSSLQGANSQAFNVDSGTSGSLSLGASNASGITLGKFGTTTTTAGIFTVNSGTSVPTADQVVIDNTASTGVTTAGVNGLSLRYKGGAAAVEAAGMRIDYTPGTTSGGTWSGLRIVESTAAGSGVNSYGLKLEGGGTGAGNSYGLEVATGWDIGIDVQSGGLQLAAQTDPAAPAAGNLRIYAKDIAGKILPKWKGPSGLDTPFQASLGFNRIAFADPGGTANCTTGVTGFGATYTTAGTCTAPQPATTNLKTSTRRLTYATTTTAGNLAYQRQAIMQVWRGNIADAGGFFFTTRFGFGALVTGNRGFIGLSSRTTNPTNVDPTTNTVDSKIGVAFNASTGNLQFISNSAGTAPTVTDLGATIPMSTTDLYELILYSATNGTTIGYRVTDISTGGQVSGSVSTNMPAVTVFMSPLYWITNNAQNASASFDFGGWYLESDQ